MKRIIENLQISTLLMAAGIVAGISIRLLLLGQAPLLDSEATLALQSLSLANGKAAELAGYPLYLILTTILTYLFQPSNFVVRLVPLLAGCAVLVLPLLLGKNLKAQEKVLLVWLIALEPALIASSRAAGSDVLTLAAALSFWSAWRSERKVPGGILLGLFLLSGPGFVVALVYGGIAWLISGWNWNADPVADLRRFLSQKSVWLGTLITLGLAGSFFMLIPSGWAAIGEGIAGMFAKLFAPSGASSLLVLLAVLVFSPLVWVFGVWGGIRAWSRRSKFEAACLSIAVINFLFLLIFPGRSPLGLAWSSLPLAYLAAREISDRLGVGREDLIPTGGIALLLAGIVLFIIQLFGRLVSGSVDTRVFWLALGGGVVILILTALLAVFGWSFRVAGQGFTWGLLLLLAANAVMSSAQSVQLEKKTYGMLWTNGQVASEQKLLVNTIEEVSRWQRGTPDGLQIALMEEIPASLEWNLRSQRFLKVVDGLGPGEQPPLVITHQITQPGLAASYRGQDFFLNSRIAIDSFNTVDWMKWLMVRSAIIQNSDTYILWARSDVFPGGIINPISEE